MSNDPEQIRREIERTRSELSDNVNALGDKVHPGSIAERQVVCVRGAAISVKDAVQGSAGTAAGTAGEAVADASCGRPQGAGLTPRRRPDRVRRRPAGVLAAAGQPGRPAGRGNVQGHRTTAGRRPDRHR